MRSRSASAACSGCGQRSSRVHCYYQRTLADRPVAGRRVRIELRARRLACGNHLLLRLVNSPGEVLAVEAADGVDVPPARHRRSSLRHA
ncbi:transposase family protein [Streptomyces sp. NBC_01006]|uniref:transposase family protein n=1 Tax=Streptomyces sp. NBC_01006 TaxID=2903716 RepID=UPI003870A416